MPMHDWTRVEPTIYHHFHQCWSVGIADALNAGLLPPGLSALIEQHARRVVPDVLTVERRTKHPSGGHAGLATVPPTRMRVEAQPPNVLLQRANRIAIRHRLAEVVCIIEIVSPGNKASRSAVQQFVEKTQQYLRAGVHLLLVDPFPPGLRDPQSLHKLIWDDIEEAPFELPADEPLLLASYCVRDLSVGLSPVAYLEPFSVGAVMPDMPAWIDADSFVPVPLERTYQAAWDVCPGDFRYLVEHGRLPDE
jgi:hypothetical protein